MIMNTLIDQPRNDNTYRRGIISRNCVVRKDSESGSAVRTVFKGTMVQIHSVKQENVRFCIVNDENMKEDIDYLLCKKSDILSVPENLWGPLFTLTPDVRYEIIQEKKLSEVLGNISVGNIVNILGNNGKELCIGKVTFRSSIPKFKPGIYFGLEIMGAMENCHSIINEVSVMKPTSKGFPQGCDVIVKISNLRPVAVNCVNRTQPIYEFEGSQLKNTEVTGNTSYKTMLVLHLKEKSPNSGKKCSPMIADGDSYAPPSNINCSHIKNDLRDELPLAVGDEVVWLSDEGPEKGTARWLGFIEDRYRVGVEFDNPVGSGSGVAHGVERFKAKFNHALFLPVESLIRLSDFQIGEPKPKNNNVNYNNNNNTACCEARWQGGQGRLAKGSHHPPCPQHPERQLPELPPCLEDMLNNKARLKPSRASDGFLYHSSKSFDVARPSERKLSNRRHCASMDSDLLKEPKVLNLHNHNLHDPTGPPWGKHEQGKCGQDQCLNLVGSEENCCDGAGDRGNVDDFHEKDVWEGSPTWSSDDSAGYYDTPKPLNEGPPATGDLGKGSMVQLTYKGKSHYGVIRWIGKLPGHSNRLMAGVEMEEESPHFSDGTFNGRRYFQCKANKAQFVPLHRCERDSRFLEEHHRPAVAAKPSTFGQIDCPVVEGTIPPINRKGDLEAICGKNRGIQGHHNSCYLDATLFAMFAFTGVFDSLLYRPPTKFDIPQYGEVQRVLRDEIVNPLRKNLYVRADRVMKLRTLLEKLSSVTGLTSEEKDPEEFLNSLVAQILKAEPFLKLSSGQEAFHYQLFVEKDERLTFPSVQQLFEQSFLTSDIKLKQVPSCLIIQMPRFGKSFKMYQRILPPQLLDVTDIIENSPRQCTVCGKLAELECRDCFGQHGIGNGLESIAFCSGCLETAHSHHCRARHNYRSLTVPTEFSELQEHCVIPRIFMELFAVVCIETSHYVSFVKCGSGSDAPWCFFDSMADRKGEQNGYNIPEMVPCPDLPYWLSDDGAKTLHEMRDERQMPELAKRLLCDAYMCMYQSPDMMMYR